MASCLCGTSNPLVPYKPISYIEFRRRARKARVLRFNTEAIASMAYT